MPVATEMLVADERWIGLALLHREHPERAGFTVREIHGRIARDYLHNLANLPPNSARYRMFCRLKDGMYRLFRPGDSFRSPRKGKTKPNVSDLPPGCRGRLSWYEEEYCVRNGSVEASEDPALQMVGVGQGLRREGGDAFIEREQSNWEIESPSPTSDLTLAERSGESSTGLVPWA